jgi:hypothetical protein
MGFLIHKKHKAGISPRTTIVFWPIDRLPHWRMELAHFRVGTVTDLRVRGGGGVSSASGRGGGQRGQRERRG